MSDFSLYPFPYIKVSNVTIGGNVSGQEYGVFAAENSVVQVGGNVTASKEDGCGVSVIESSVTVNGDVSGAYGIEADGGSSVTIKGNVESEKGQLVSIWGSEKTSVIIEGDASGSSELEFDVIGSDNKDSEIAVGGTVKNAEHGAAILVRVDENGKTGNIPEIVVGEIEDINKVEVKDYKTKEKVSDEEKQAILDKLLNFGAKECFRERYLTIRESLV